VCVCVFYLFILTKIHLYISDIDPKLPTAFEENIQIFIKNDTEVLHVGNINQVEYFKCKQCDTSKFLLYSKYKWHVAVVHLKIENDSLGKFWES
jgi:hypothetical protein